MRNGEHKRSYFIGRAGDIRLNHTSVSRHHACLEVSDSSITLQDLGSHNGTYRIRGLEALPFTGGEIYLDEVFAFSVCIRSVRQMLEDVGETGTWRLSGDRPDNPSDSAPAIVRTAASQTLSTNPEVEVRSERVRAKIGSLLAEARARPEIYATADGSHENSGASGEDDHSVAALKQEIDALKNMLASVCRERDAAQRISDLSLERIELQDSLISRLETTSFEADANSTAELPQFVEADVKLESLEGQLDLDRRYFVSKNR